LAKETIGDQRTQLPKAAKNTESIARLDWTRTELTPPRPGKVKFAMRIDPDLLAWFRGQGRGYQTRINTILRAYYDQMRDRNAP
jgi:uncharacterized protein (DUF4415 family)